MDTYDIAVVGASVAGCSTAILLANRGYRVLLVDKVGDMSRYKVLCTHFIQPCAQAAAREIGLDDDIEELGGVRAQARAWTRWGWIEDPHQGGKRHQHGYGIRRETLDPYLRNKAAEHPRIELRLGTSLMGVRSEKTGVTIKLKTGSQIDELNVGLLVGADGRNSKTASEAGIETRTIPNGRFSYFAYFKGIDHPGGNVATQWFLDPDVAYSLPNDAGTTVIAIIPEKSKLHAFKEDLEGAYYNFVRSLPCGPEIDKAEKVSKIIGSTDLPLIRRNPTAPRVALVGDAAYTSDPLWGTGCGWAMQHALWLAESLSYGVADEIDVERGLSMYNKHQKMLNGHRFLIEDFASGRKLNWIERTLFSGATSDTKLAKGFWDFGGRQINATEFINPVNIARAYIHGRKSRKELA